MDKRKKIFSAAGIIMSVIGTVFLIIALSHPELSFPWPNPFTYTFYAFYLIATVLMFRMSKRNIKKD